jgi:hypothetical protein
MTLDILQSHPFGVRQIEELRSSSGSFLRNSPQISVISADAAITTFTALMSMMARAFVW